MPGKTKRIILFDIDGTLIGPSQEDHHCFKQAIEDTYGVTGPIDSYDMAGKTDWQIITELMGLAGVPAERIEARRMDAFRAYAQHVELSLSTFRIHLLPGVSNLLDRLADDPRFILGLVTGNVQEIVPHKLRRAGIPPTIFEVGAYGSEHIDRNTLPLLALYRLGQKLGASLQPGQVLIIGDTPRDIACARHAGVKVMSVATGRFDTQTLQRYNPDYLVNNLADTDQVMTILEAY